MLRISLIALSVFLLTVSTGHSADMDKVKAYILRNIYYDATNPIFKEEDKRITDGFKSVLMGGAEARAKDTVQSTLQKLYDSLAIEFSDSNESRRGHCMTAVYFAQLALLSAAGEIPSYDNRPMRLLTYAEYALSAANDADILARQHLALLSLDFYFTEYFNYKKVSKYLPNLSREEQAEFNTLFKKEIAESKKNKDLQSAPVAEVRLRPAEWGAKVIGSGLENFYRLDEHVFRSEQPNQKEFANLKRFGIKEVLNLRQYHSDDDEAKKTSLVLHRLKMNAGSVSYSQIRQALEKIKNAKGPILIHCWHGSDRTGVVSAAYRVVFQKWPKAKAVDEMRNGEYGYHERFYPGLVQMIMDLDVAAFRQKLGLEK